MRFDLSDEEWAGKYRQSPRNIGIEAYLIPTEMRQLVDNVRFWVENETYPPDEIAVRFSHQLVSIHPFPNGNGRHSRMAGDYLAIQLGQPPFTWGRTSLTNASETRKAYIAALQRRHQTTVEICAELAGDSVAAQGKAFPPNKIQLMFLKCFYLRR